VAVGLESGRAARVRRAWAVVVGGAIVNPDGATNQIEGGDVQAISWTLHEAVTWDQGGILTRGWDSYATLRFDEVLQVEVALVDQADGPSLGLGGRCRRAGHGRRRWRRRAKSRADARPAAPSSTAAWRHPRLQTSRLRSAGKLPDLGRMAVRRSRANLKPARQDG
jgi:hypothetical protein